MSALRRIDTIELRRDAGVTRSVEGFLSVPAYLSRTGLQDYLRSDGTISTEYRGDAEVFAESSLASFRGKPLTLGHPPSNLTPKTARVYATGAIGDDVRRADDGIHVAATVHVWDEEAIAAYDSGESIELSMGYTIEPGPGGVTPEGKRFDVSHTQIVGNHGAQLPRGRAGSARMMTDAEPTTSDLAPLLAAGRRPSSPVVVDLGSWVRRDAADLARTRPTTDHEDTPTMKFKIKLDGKDVEIEVADKATPEQIAEATAKAHADAAEVKRKAAEEAAKRDQVEVNIGGTKQYVSKTVADALTAGRVAPAPKSDEAEEAKRKADEQVKLDALEDRADVLGTARAVRGIGYTGRDDQGKALTGDAMRLDIIESELGAEKRKTIDALPEADRRGATRFAYADALAAIAAKPSKADGLLGEINRTRDAAGINTKADAEAKKLADQRAKFDADAAIPASMRTQKSS